MRRKSGLSAAYELFSSMRFAISLLSILGLASVIGTVLQQNQPYVDYVLKFGAFWFALFKLLGLFDVYHAPWFMGILAFLVFSTSACIVRNTPSMLKNMRGYRKTASIPSLLSFQHHQRLSSGLPSNALQSRIQTWLLNEGYQAKIDVRSDGVMIAAKKGTLQRVGYFCAHSSIVLICIGGLLDSNINLSLLRMFAGKAPESRDLFLRDVPEKSRLGVGNLSYRAFLPLAEGQSSHLASLRVENNQYFVQDLPFSVQLEKFKVAHYSTGMPKSFASDILVTDLATGAVERATVQVNHPYKKHGISLYQSDFGDGGSGLSLAAWDLTQNKQAVQTLQATSLSSQTFTWAGQTYQLEWGAFRAFNIEQMNNKQAETPLHNLLNVKHAKGVRNFGPSIVYKLRDNTGQAIEYTNYMLPATLEDGNRYAVTGLRARANDPLDWVFLPVDEQGRLTAFMQVYASLMQDAQLEKIALQLAKRVQSTPEQQAIAARGMAISMRIFAQGGMPKLNAMLEKNVPDATRRQAFLAEFSDTLSAAALLILQEQAPKQANDAFARASILAYSSLQGYPAPVWLQLQDFKSVQSSTFQLTRSPGQPLVYIGSVLLVLGVMIMFYLREWRVWVYLRQDKLSGTDETEVVFAMTGNRHGYLLGAYFAQQLAALSALCEKKAE